MSDSDTVKVRDILTDVDKIMRERLAAAGLDIEHVILAITPDGTGIVRTNVGPATLGDMAELLDEISGGADLQRPDNEPLN